MSTGLAVEVVRGVQQAASLLGHPLRLKVLEHLAEPDSAAGLARRLGVPRQVLNYHLRALEAPGMLTFVEERPRGGLKERRAAGDGAVVPDQPRGDGGGRARPEAAAGPLLLGVPGGGGGEGRARPGDPPRSGRPRRQAAGDVHARDRGPLRLGRPTATRSRASWRPGWRSWR